VTNAPTEAQEWAVSKKVRITLIIIIITTITTTTTTTAS